VAYFKNSVDVDDCVESKGAVIDELAGVWKKASCGLMNGLAKPTKLVVCH
jgi:hypothetical protein